MNKYISLIYLSALVVSSCGGGGPNGAQQSQETLLSNASLDAIQTEGVITKFGYISSQTRETPSAANTPADINTYFVASFREFEQGMPDAAIELLDDMYGPDTLQRCISSTESDLATSPERQTAFEEYNRLTLDIPKTALFAGSELFLTIPDSDSVTASPINEQHEYYKLTDGDYRDNWFPSNTVIDIPGEDFPSVNAAVLSTVAPWIDFASSVPRRQITAGTNISWTPPENPDNSLVTVVLMGSRNLFCHVPDIGSFTLPLEVGQLGFINRIVGVRTSFNYLQIDDALLLTTANAEQDASFP